ncbi:MAG: 5-deoxy-glucuronate isomerase [Nitrospirota bacterium]|nr:5-deoxy-glucuronate isomerase [Nitrospirota bacterium]MDE3225714.1 5-deoxy-glucuronate isomerase [Nitrospirota bacterium]MDE3241130.1 5-deoxy-glucuronate isomerase [Nitrospirota bacterium]
MSQYRFCNERLLKDLQVDGEGTCVTFRTPSEVTAVHFDEQRIEKVVHEDLHTGRVSQLGPEAAHHIVVGSGNWERDVYHFLKPSESPHLQLRLGLTVHRGEGTWSSLPHHFETCPEQGFEEVFFYLLRGGTERAIQVGRGLWADGSPVDAVWPVAHRAFGVVPMGYHPVVGEPGVKVSYIWGYVAKKKSWEKI